MNTSLNFRQRLVKNFYSSYELSNIIIKLPTACSLCSDYPAHLRSLYVYYSHRFEGVVCDNNHITEFHYTKETLEQRHQEVEDNPSIVHKLEMTFAAA